jgi:hypothetical protein
MSDEKNEKKVDLNNRNIKRYSVFKETKSKKALIPPNVTSQENLIASKFTSNENFDQNIAELNNEMAKQETNLYNLGLMEARNIANTSDLQQLSNEINKKFNISTVPIIPLNNQNDDKSKSEKKSLGKSKKNRATISEIVEESPQNNSSPLSRKMTKIDINKMGIVKAHTRSQGTNVGNLNNFYYIDVKKSQTLTFSTSTLYMRWRKSSGEEITVLMNLKKP